MPGFNKNTSGEREKALQKAKDIIVGLQEAAAGEVSSVSQSSAANAEPKTGEDIIHQYLSEAKRVYVNAANNKDNPELLNECRSALVTLKELAKGLEDMGQYKEILDAGMKEIFSFADNPYGIDPFLSLIHQTNNPQMAKFAEEYYKVNLDSLVAKIDSALIEQYKNAVQGHFIDGTAATKEAADKSGDEIIAALGKLDMRLNKSIKDDMIKSLKDAQEQRSNVMESKHSRRLSF